MLTLSLAACAVQLFHPRIHGDSYGLSDMPCPRAACKEAGPLTLLGSRPAWEGGRVVRVLSVSPSAEAGACRVLVFCTQSSRS